MNDYTSFAELYDLFYDDFTEDLEMYRGFAERTGGPILEIGSGTGRVALALAEEGHTVVGLELSEAMRAVAQRKADRAQLTDRVKFIAGDMRRFKLDQHFGLIIVPLNTFLHNLTLDDQLATLACCKKHLRPGGLLVLDCFNPDPAHAEDDRRLIVQRSVIDRDTGRPRCCCCRAPPIGTSNCKRSRTSSIGLINTAWCSARSCRPRSASSFGMRCSCC